MRFDGDAILEKVSPMIEKIRTNKYMQGISQGFMMALPIVIMGSFAFILKIIPIPAYKEFIMTSGIGNILAIPIKFTTNFTAVIYAFCIAYRLAQQFKLKEGIIGLISIVCFFIVTPFDPETGNILTQWLGSQAIFSAMLVAIISVKLYHLIEKLGWVVKMPPSVPDFISNTFTSLIPSIVVMSFFTMIAAVFTQTSFGSVHQFVFTMIQTPLTAIIGGNLISALLIAFLCQICWLFGIHGIVVLSIVTPIWKAMDVAQLTAAQAGDALPNILGYQFNMHYASNSVLPIAILLVLFAKSKQNKTMAKVSAIPAVFSVSEPMVFGLPIILNPIWALPWMLYPLICFILPYFATSLGIIPPMMGIELPFGTPMIISGFLQGSWKIAAMQGILILIGCALYYPFFKYYDKQLVEEEQGMNTIIKE